MKKKHFENIVGKGENADNQHFRLFPQCFLPIPERFCFYVKFILSSANAFNLDKSKILLFGKKLTHTSKHAQQMQGHVISPLAFGKWNSNDQTETLASSAVIC